ncbi:MAG: large-conductance mechanosensitive channel protein MscL [Sphingobacteriales bacterium]|nr:large-conductance mechanosensitive channel protein MscL [Sphingobacteriales bacterium]MCC7223023.1 large-conductance mechanosensitive channel protein MscL [Chitinophagales bacterium]
MGFVSEFKEFALKGNVLDMAIGVVIGAAFGKVISAVVDNLLSPIIGMVTGSSLANSFQWVLKEAVLGPDGKETAAAVAIKLGAILQVIIDFFFVALFVFIIVKAMNAAKKKEAEAPAAPPAPSNEEVLLGEIRDLLKQR